MRILICLLFVILLSSCKKEEAISEIPTIAFVSILPNTAQEYLDKIIITISYTDGDGNLGENNPDIKNLFVEDNRNGIEYQFRIPKLSPNGSTIVIEGNFNVTINGTGITNESSSQKVEYSIYVNDRAGNKSNIITTSEITIQE
tara:strand:- start:6113 stop:6544 length:432 start_codon:yes stop_codon:yes gene_type:complete